MVYHYWSAKWLDPSLGGWVPSDPASRGWGMVEGDHDVTESEMLKWLTACRYFSKLHRDQTST